MNRILGITALASIISITAPLVAEAQQALYLAYPPDNHKTVADRIFLIGTAEPSGEVLVNGKPIKRSRAGHFAPSFPLIPGENRFILRYNNQNIEISVFRETKEAETPTGLGFVKDSLTPAQDISRLPGELICFEAIASNDATVTVELGEQTIPLLPQSQTVKLPPNSALLTETNEPSSLSIPGKYSGCTTISEVGDLGYPIYKLTLDGETITQEASAKVEILSPANLQVVEITSKSGVTRTGPNTDYSRLTPLPQGTRAAVTGSQGEWLRLDYGAWIKKEETSIVPNSIPPQSIIRSVRARQLEDATEIIFPLEVPIPVSVQQGEKTIKLTLYNTVAQTDTIRFDDNPIIKRLDWQQISPTQVEYTFHLKTEQQWGYDLRYEGTSLIFTLRHPPQVNVKNSLKGVKILLDPGHGGKEWGAKGPTGYKEKDINLVMSKLLQAELEQRGATVYLTRESDIELSLQDRIDIINQIKPTIALSIHYNSLPDNGDALRTMGVGTFWYHPQAHDLSLFLHDYLTQNLNRPSYGVFWNNLALTRPNTAPSVLLELGFMINPEEFEWITNPQSQSQLAEAIADGLTAWFHQ